MQKTALITGASRGIGASCAKLLAQNGYNVAINYCNSFDKAQQVKQEILSNGGVAEIFCADVSKINQVNSMINDVVKRFGSIDLVVCNAGVAYTGLLIDTKEEDFDKIININLKGVFNVSKSVLPIFLEKRAGNIICISSVWGQTGGSCEVVYSASKSAVIGFTKALAKEVGLMGVRVNCICPGVIETDMINNLTKEDKVDLKEQTPLNRLGNPLDVANAVLFLASPESSFVTGQIIGVNGGFLI